MLNAIYYPHTAVREEKFLKHALLYWDQVEYISPFDNFDALPRYSDDTKRKLARFLKPRVPTEAEKARAHIEIMKLIEHDLPLWLRIDRAGGIDDWQSYMMFRDKLLPETWHELQERGVVQFKKHGDLNDYVSHTYLGLTLMAILARCCAGTFKHTITDQSDAYGSLLKHLEFLSGGTEDSDAIKKWLETLAVRQPQAEDTERETLVSITLDVIDAESLSVDTLIKLRTDKQALGAKLRENYSNAVEEYVRKLTATKLTETDAMALRDEFRRKMDLDLKGLFEELGPQAKKTIVSRDLLIALAAPLAGAAVLTASGLGTVLGGALAVGALGKLKIDYAAARDATFKNHSMAFLYAAKGMRLY